MKKRKNSGLFIAAVSACLVFLGCGRAEEAYIQGMKLAEASKYEKSLPYFEEAIREDDEQGDYYLGYGMALNHLGQYQESEEKFLQALKKGGLKDSQKKQIYYGLSLSYFGMGDYESTLKYVSKALKVNALDEMNEEISYTQAVAYERLGKHNEALGVCQSLLKKNNKNIKAYQEKAALEEMTGDVSQAQKTYKEAIRVMPKEYTLYFALYHLYMQEKQTDAANEVLEPLLALKTDSAEEMLAKGRAYLCAGDTNAAREEFKAAYDKGEGKGLFYLGEAARADAENEEAKKWYAKYREEAKKDGQDVIPWVYVRQAEQCYDKKEYQEGAGMIEEGLSLGMTEATRELWRLQVIFCEKQGDYSQAKEYVKRYLDAYPDDKEMIKEKKFIATRIK